MKSQIQEGRDEGELNHRGRRSALIFFPISVPLRLCGKNPLLSAPHPWLKTSFLPNEPKLKIIKHCKSIGCENTVWLRFQNEPIFIFGESLCVCLPALLKPWREGKSRLNDPVTLMLDFKLLIIND